MPRHNQHRHSAHESNQVDFQASEGALQADQPDPRDGATAIPFVGSA